MHTLLRTWKGDMQTSLRTWSGDIDAGTKKTKLAIFPNFGFFSFETTYSLGVYMTYVTPFKLTNITYVLLPPDPNWFYAAVNK